MNPEPFGRQPLPVTITISGEDPDVVYWMQKFTRQAEFKGDTVTRLGPSSFRIHPRAVND